MEIDNSANKFELKRIIRAHRDTVTCISFPPRNFRVFVTGSWDRRIRIWNKRSMKSIKFLKKHHLRV